MNAADLVGYTHDGAIYCPRHVPQAKNTRCNCGDVDRNGACLHNCHGYGPQPLFYDWAQPGDSCDVPGCGYLDGCEPEPETALDE